VRRQSRPIPSAISAIAEPQFSASVLKLSWLLLRTVTEPCTPLLMAIGHLS
jgi:hypothetical protein